MLGCRECRHFSSSHGYIVPLPLLKAPSNASPDTILQWFKIQISLPISNIDPQWLMFSAGRSPQFDSLAIIERFVENLRVVDDRFEYNGWTWLVECAAANVLHCCARWTHDLNAYASWPPPQEHKSLCNLLDRIKYFRHPSATMDLCRCLLGNQSRCSFKRDSDKLNFQPCHSMLFVESKRWRRKETVWMTLPQNNITFLYRLGNGFFVIRSMGNMRRFSDRKAKSF